MSVNYHAFQCRGFLFDEYEAHKEHWLAFFQNYNPERVVRILGLTADENYLYLTYYQVPYRMRLTDGTLEKQVDGAWTTRLFFNEAMVCYHLLYYVKDAPLCLGQWVPNTALDGVISRTEPQHDPLFFPFEQRFSGRAAQLEEICRDLGGIRQEKGDVCYEFEAFPQVHLQVLFYDADEDFPAQVKVLVDRRVTDYIHFETTGCLISDLFERMEALDDQKTGTAVTE